MFDIIYEFGPLVDHVTEHIALYALGSVIALLCIYFTRPYSVSLILYAIEIGIYLFVMHTVMYVLVLLIAWFSHATQFRGVREDAIIDATHWTTPWLRFWEWELYDPLWLLWLEIVLAALIIALVRYYRPMKVQRKLKTRVTPPPRKKKTGAGDDDDGWGVATTRRHVTPHNIVEGGPKKK